MIKKEYVIIAETGLHARPATMLVNLAGKFDSDVFLTYKGNNIDFKSIIGVLSLGIYLNEIITITCNGLDEEVASKEIGRLLQELNIAKEV